MFAVLFDDEIDLLLRVGAAYRLACAVTPRVRPDETTFRQQMAVFDYLRFLRERTPVTLIDG